MPTDQKPRTSLTTWVFPAMTFVLGAVVAYVLASPPATPAPSSETPMFGASAPAVPAPAPAPAAPLANSASAAELSLMRDINAQFVTQLRRYEDRLRAIAADAENEGAPEAAESMRDFAFETETVINRYDSILKKQ